MDIPWVNPYPVYAVKYWVKLDDISENDLPNLKGSV